MTTEKPITPLTPARADLSPRAVFAVLALLFAAGLALRLWEFRAYLPHVFYSDYVQVDQAAELLHRGTFVDRSSYPATHTFILAGADLIAYGVGSLTGDFEGWTPFVEALWKPDDPTLRQSIARVYTALLGASMVFAVYGLARLRLTRGQSALAAAMMVFSPAHVIYGHQARIHVPGILFLTVAAIPVLTIAIRESGFARAFAAGAACAAVASVFQLGYVLCAVAAAFCLLLTGSSKRRFLGVLSVALGFGVTAVLLLAITHGVGLSTPLEGNAALDNAGTLGIPTVTVSGLSISRFMDRFPRFFVNWVLAEPMIALGALTFAAGALLGFRFGDRTRMRTLLAYGLYPAIIFFVLGTTYTKVRYSLSVTPFLAVLAAAGLTSVRVKFLRIPGVALAIALPLATSIRYDALLSSLDSRILLREALTTFSHSGLRSAVEHAIVLPVKGARAKVTELPPKGDYRAWTNGEETPVQTLQRLEADIVVGSAGMTEQGALSASVLRSLGYVLCARLTASPATESYLPDTPENLVVTVWVADRSGPTIDFYAKPPLRKRVHNLLPAPSIVKFLD